MKLRKFEAASESEAISKVKNELGMDALILSVRKIQRKGFFGFFKKPLVEVTAAYDEKSGEAQKEREMSDIQKNKLLIEQELKNRKISDQQATIDNLKFMLSEMTEKLKVASYSENIQRKYESSILQAFYDTMTFQGVLPDIADSLLEDAVVLDNSENINLNLAAKIVYNNIINVLGEPSPIRKKKNRKRAKVVVLMGPTGVGKTTTIAKLSANFILKDSYKVGLITSDTYRIAAVDQLKTYADILGVEVGVVFEEKELKARLEEMSAIYDIICVDTAGRSHKNKEGLGDLKELLNYINKNESEKYLVLSLTTKYEDLLDIINTFASITDFKLIFTKWDETLSYGTILNICYKTGKKADYVTMGQNVPDDIELMKPEILARALLGLGDGING